MRNHGEGQGIGENKDQEEGELSFLPALVQVIDDAPQHEDSHEIERLGERLVNVFSRRTHSVLGTHIIYQVLLQKVVGHECHFLIVKAVDRYQQCEGRESDDETSEEESTERSLLCQFVDN
jgi:hypothetical protein